MQLQQMTSDERLIADYSGTDLTIGKHPMEYRRGDQVPAMQRRMLDAVGVIPGAESVGLVNPAPLYAGSVG